jgi:hypothetical protein
MRGTLLIGLAAVLLIIGVLVMKNMGADSSSGTQETKAEAYMEKARVAAEDVDKRLIDIKKSAD